MSSKSSENFSTTRTRLGIMFFVQAVIIVLVLFYLVVGLQWRNRPFLGVMLDHNMVVNKGQPNTTTAWNGLEAGLQPGDQILSIGRAGDDTPQNLADRAYTDVLRDFEPGDRIEVTFTRNLDQAETDNLEAFTCSSITATTAECSVQYTLMHLPSGDFLALYVVPIASALIVIAAGLLLMWLRPNDANTFIINMGFAALVLYMGGIFDASTTHYLIPLWLVSGVMVGASLITLGLVYPTPLPVTYRRPWFGYLPVAFGLVFSIALLAQFSSDDTAISGAALQTSGFAAIVGMGILVTILYFYQRPLSANQRIRDQANVVFLAAAFSLAPSILWMLNFVARALFDAPLISFSIESAMPFYTIPAIGLVYTSLEFNHFDTERAISKAITYTIMLVALIFGYGLLVSGMTLLTLPAFSTDNPIIIVMVIFAISVLFIPVRTRLQDRIEALYFRTRRDFQEKAEAFTHRLTGLSHMDPMITAYRDDLNENVAPSSVLLFLLDPSTGQYKAYGNPEPESDLIFAPDSSLIAYLSRSDSPLYLSPDKPWPSVLHMERAKLSILNARVLVGLAGSEVLNGFISITPPRSGKSGYTFEEIRFITSISAQLAIAVERAIVIESLERRVRELDVLSQVGQAVNFTIEFDDLIELISAQTLKLIQSPFFYIALHEPATSQMYFAFYLENDDRFTDRENKRWPVGRDLYSDVIRTNAPIQVGHYVNAMTRNNYSVNLENPETRAWMGVPLIAGQRTLGVLALGETAPEKQFTADQLRILSNIGALAATSIEKARLFNDANVRARQLTALNDISRQLVATEGDVEQLLDLIMSSAVDILNAEAGSLLLTAEDESQDLEFKVAVGSGEDLVGTRLPAGHGLVGKVALTGTPVISNDTSSDSDWEGEVLEGGFKTNSILAVPLIAKDRVVGVVEVINKRDGSSYAESDVELLTTFAAQAAVAFENARLFQQTDIQLNRRVQELEALERIDRELNRTLDVHKVGEITVRWAIANSNAKFGLLGIISDDKTMLQIVASQGYSDDDQPEGAAGDYWPLDRGIAKRVMRTRRADLQPYVQMDPDYVPSLRNSLSQITVPMISAGEIDALLVLETDEEPRLNLLDLDWVQRLGEHASIAIANAQLYYELTRANETKSEFMAFAAHELKNPLTPVKGYAAALKSQMITNMPIEEVQKIGGIIESNAAQMQNIINDLRDIAASDANKLDINLAPISFRSVVNDTLITYQKQLEEKNQTVLNDVAEDLPLILGDPKRLAQVMLNFISNANKYSPPESTLIIAAKVMQHFLNRQNQNIGPVLHISVKDNGIGMSDEDLAQIFQKDYFRSENPLAREQKGTGLGMMITQRIIQGHNGEVWVESKLGEGSTFQFVIPLAPEEPAEVENLNGRSANGTATTLEQNTTETETQNEPASD